MTAVAQPTVSRGLWPWSLYAAMLGAAGLPIYIHAPKFYAETWGVELATMGVVLALLRLVDVVQDPLLGWFAEAGRRQRPLLALAGTIGLALAMVALFAVPPPIAPLAWFTLSLGALFTSFSLLTILFYAQAVERGAAIGTTGHLAIASWREAGTLIGISLAAMAPFVLGAVTDQPFAAFSFGFATVALIALVSMRTEWVSAVVGRPKATYDLGSAFGPALGDPIARRLLIVSVINAAPVAVTSTLFLFFVDSRLGAPDWSGPLLMAFFLSAAAAAPVWTGLAARFGEKPVLLAAMALSIAAFAWALALQEGDIAAFAAICVASGAAMAADMTLLPAMFARRLAQLKQGGESGAFGLWSFASKMSLALAAALLLPALQVAGYKTTGQNPDGALTTLALLYAGLPCLLKIAAMALVARSDLTTE